MKYLFEFGEITKLIISIVKEANKENPDNRLIENKAIEIENLAFSIAEEAKAKQ